jgi:hypothetical protein
MSGKQPRENRRIERQRSEDAPAGPWKTVQRKKQVRDESWSAGKTRMGCLIGCEIAGVESLGQRDSLMKREAQSFAGDCVH